VKSLFRLERTRRGVRLAQYGLATVGALALAYCVTVYLQGILFEAREANKFSRELRYEAAGTDTLSRAADPGTLPQDGAVLGELEVPRLGLSVMVVEGVKDGDLNSAAGHIPGTALPGQPGNVGIAGHRDTFFRPLRAIQQNDMMILSTLRGAYRYRVVSLSVARPEDVQVLSPTQHDSLTLVTCFPFDYVGSAPERFIVRAERLRK
jgi:sortase A